MKNKMKINITKEVLKGKPRNKKEWRDECKKRGVKQATFYYHFNKLKNTNEIKYLSHEKVYQLVERDFANTKEIRLYINYIKSSNAKLRKYGIRDLTSLCASRIVTHDPSLIQFFETAFADSSYQDIHVQLLDAFRCVLIRCLKEEQEEKAISLLEQNNSSLLKFIRDGPLALQKKALSTFTLRTSKETLGYLYEIIQTKSNEDYQYLQGVIKRSLCSHLQKYKLDIKTKLFEIALMNTSEEIKDRVVDLLGELSGFNDHIQDIE